MKKIIILLIFAFIPAAGFGLTRSELRTEIRTQIKDAHSTRVRLTDAQLNSMINQAQRDINNATWVCVKSTDIALVASTTYYTMPTDVITILRATKDYKLISETSLEKLDAESSGWQNVSRGEPSSYFQDPAMPDSIGVHPVPSTASQLGTLRFNYVAQVEDMDEDADVPFLEYARVTPYHDTIVWYVCYRIMLFEGLAERAKSFASEYDSRLALMRDRIGQKPNFNPGFGGERK